MFLKFRNVALSHDNEINLAILHKNESVLNLNGYTLFILCRVWELKCANLPY